MTERVDGEGLLATLGQRVRVVRTMAGLTAGQLERLAGLEDGTVDGIESGTLDFDPRELMAVADFTGVTVDFLIGFGVDDPCDYYGRLGKYARERRAAMVGLARSRTVPVYDPSDPDDVACMLDIALARSGATAGESRRLIESLDS